MFMSRHDPNLTREHELPHVFKRAESSPKNNQATE